jgi:hypothetical protein
MVTDGLITTSRVTSRMTVAPATMSRREWAVICRGAMKVR